MRNKLYIDGGYHRGDGYMEMLERQIVRRSWIKVGFEPNPEIEWLPNWVQRCALGASHGYVTFFPRGPAEKADGMGSTMLPDFKQAIGGFHADPVTVPCKRLADVIDYRLRKHRPETVVLKLDVEGAEYEIVRDLLATGIASKITDAYIEWHHREKTFDHPKTEVEELKQALRDQGVRVHYHQ